MTAVPLFDPGGYGQPHPARFNDAILGVIAGHLEPGWSVFDPFCGAGGVHQLRRLVPGLRTQGCEIEPKWAAAHPDTICSDLFDLTYPPDSFDAVVTSCAYGNRMADHHNALDGSRRNTYRHTYGEPLHPNNGGLLRWGPDYRRFHEQTWTHVGPWAPRLILNVKDHYRGPHVMPVTAWHKACLKHLGWRLRTEERIDCPGNRHGANGDHRVPYESVLVFARTRRSR